MIITRGLFNFNPIFEDQFDLFKGLFLKILSFCTVGIQERVIMAWVPYMQIEKSVILKIFELSNEQTDVIWQTYWVLNSMTYVTVLLETGYNPPRPLSLHILFHLEAKPFFTKDLV